MHRVSEILSGLCDCDYKQRIMSCLFCALGAKGAEEAGVNRDYLAQRMTDEINEIIRVLQLTTYDEDEWDADNLTGMKRALTVIDSKMQAAHDWLGVRMKISGIWVFHCVCLVSNANVSKILLHVPVFFYRIHEQCEVVWVRSQFVGY